MLAKFLSSALQDTKSFSVNTHTDTLLCCSFTRVSVTTHCCLAGLGGRWRRRKALTGTTVSDELEAASTSTPIAAGCVHALLGAWSLLAALVHIWRIRETRWVHVCLGMQRAAGVAAEFTCLAPVAHPAERAGAAVGSQAGASVHTGLFTHSCRRHFKQKLGKCSTKTLLVSVFSLSELPWLQLTEWSLLQPGQQSG